MKFGKGYSVPTGFKGATPDGKVMIFPTEQEYREYCCDITKEQEKCKGACTSCPYFYVEEEE